MGERLGTHGQLQKQEGLQHLVAAMLQQQASAGSLELGHSLLCMLYYLACRPLDSCWSAVAAAAGSSGDGSPARLKNAGAQMQAWRDCCC